MLNNLLEKNSCFKLVCGAGNEDTKEIEKLIAIYSSAGCNFFDVSANIDVVKAAKKGLALSGIKENRYLCVSVGIAGDPHITKAKIDNNLCTLCENCISNCPHDAIIKRENKIETIEQRCIGCSKCAKNCPQKAITMESKIKNYNETLPEIIKEGIDCIEFHAISNDIKDIKEKWGQLNALYSGMLCISIDRSTFGDIKLKELIKDLISTRKPYTTIIQADGVAMSGNNDEASTTLQAIATTQLFQNANLPAYIMMSGGTNIKTTKLARQFNVIPNCLAVGSYARKIIKDYLQMDNILENKNVFNEAVKVAKNLIDTSMEYMTND